MEKASLKHKSLISGGNMNKSSSCADKKWVPRESNTYSDNQKKNALEECKSGTSVMENKTGSGLILKGESSFTPSVVDLHVDDRIASLLSSCTLEDDPVLQEKKKKNRECGSILPGRSLTVCPKKLLVLNINGLLADVVSGHHTSYRVQKRIGGKTIFKRPFCDEFLKFCFENFDVGVWSSRRKYNVDSVVDYLLKKFKNKLLFVWDQSKCTDTGIRAFENRYKQLYLKELGKLWNPEETGLPWKKGCDSPYKTILNPVIRRKFSEETGLPWKNGEFSPSNTLLLDDSPYKAILNPPNTAIFPDPYHYDNEKDNSLGPRGDIRVYLEQLVMTDDVQQYVKEHPFGQSPITTSHKQWNFYSAIIKLYSA